jgi:VanZ family protein
MANSNTIKVAPECQTLFLCAVHSARSNFVYWLPVVLWASTIFGASSDSGSFRHSSRIIGPLVHWLFPNLSEEQIHAIVFIVRKIAHLTEFAIFALLVWNALQRPRWKDSRPWSWRSAVESLWFAVLYATTDEFHQTFVPSREGCLRDVFIDSCGAVTGMLLLWAVGRWRKFW